MSESKITYEFRRGSDAYRCAICLNGERIGEIPFESVMPAMGDRCYILCVRGHVVYCPGANAQEAFDRAIVDAGYGV